MTLYIQIYNIYIYIYIYIYVICVIYVKKLYQRTRNLRSSWYLYSDSAYNR